MKKAILYILNILVIVATIIYVVQFSLSQRDTSVQSQKEAFISTMEAMERVFYNYLLSCQNICDDWAGYVNSGTYTMPEAMEQIKRMNTNNEVSVQILDGESMTGISSISKHLNGNDYSVRYDQKYDTLYDELRGFVDAGTGDSEIHITRYFNNPLNGDFVVAFCKKITLYDENGAYDALLLYIDQLSQFKNRWVFPIGYSNAQIAMIDAEGEYVIRADSMKSENFYEFIRAYNSLTYPQSYALRDEVNANDGGGFTYLDASGKETYYAYTHLVGEKWLLVGEIPLQDLNTEGVQWSLVMVICAGFFILICLDGAYYIFLNRKLAASLSAAESANRAKTDFLSSMSHDIRTPMNAIIGMTAIAKRSINDPVRVDDCLTKISLSSDHLLTLINDVLDISRVESGKFSLNPTEFSLADAMRSLINIMYPSALEKHQHFEVYVDGIEQERVFADELRLSQIWINILSNAIKYTGDDGSVTVLLSEKGTESGKISLVYQVSDTGIGMSEEFIKKIYDSFTRATDSRINEIQGSGLGMTITKRMIDLMHGEIQIKSELGKGSVFTVSLPLEKAKGIQEEKTFAGYRVLVADADAHIVSSTLDVLSNMQITADGAVSAQQAISLVTDRRAEGNGFDVIFAGDDLPGKESTDCIRALREAAGPDKTKIVISSYDYAGLPEAKRDAGADDHIMKPYFRSVLQAKLEDIFEPDQRTDVHPREKDYTGIRVLVAEDNDLNWEIINELLSFYGIETDHALNGRDCLEQLIKAEPDRYLVIFMDIQMPVMNGYEATQAIRALPDQKRAGIPIIAMTADAFSEDIEKCLDAGMDGHIAKPLSIEKVLAEIDQYRGKGV